MHVWLLRKTVTIATNTEDYSQVISHPKEVKSGKFYLNSEKIFYKFGCYGGLPWKHGYHDNSKRQLEFYFSKELHLNFVSYFLRIKICQLKLKFRDSLLPWQQRKYQLLLCFKTA